MLPGDGEGEMEEVRDLDDDVPDADNTALEEDESEGSDEENEDRRDTQKCPSYSPAR